MYVHFKLDINFCYTEFKISSGAWTGVEINISNLLAHRTSVI